MKLRRKRWSWLVIETKSFKSLRLKEEEEDGFSSLFVIRDVNLFTFWTEETLIEDKSLSFCTCNGERWRRLFSFYKFLKQEPHEFLGTMKQGTPSFCKSLFERYFFICISSSL
ncbi:hypothetical protein AtNW77_Chr5g0119401 [Arabidopsis thaliana]